MLTSKFISSLPAQLHRGARTPHTVADALSVAGTGVLRHDVLHAFVLGADTSIRVIGVVTLIAGALVTAQSAWSSQSARSSQSSQSARSVR